MGYSPTFGISLDRLLEEMNNNDMSEIVKGFPVSEGMDIFIINAEDYTLAGCTNDDIVGMDVSKILASGEKIVPREQ